MFENRNLIAIIADSILKAQKDELFFEEIYANPDLPVNKNEFLFFIKPEITMASNQIKFNDILDMILGKITIFGLRIKNINVLSASYLEKYNIIAQHYGVINQIATNAAANLSETAKTNFQKQYGKTIEKCTILGGVEFLEKYPVFNPLSLDYLWQNKENKKLAGGTYCEDIKLDGEVVYLINAFHPRQLLHFTEQGRSIVVFTLEGDLDWSDARNNLIGATDPVKAAEGSIRRTLLENKANFGLPEVSQGMNGVHLSAGPVEGLIELIRYNSNFSQKNQIKDFRDFSFGKLLADNFTEDQIKYILSNPNVSVEGKVVSVFDLTEEQNSYEAVDKLKGLL